MHLMVLCAAVLLLAYGAVVVWFRLNEKAIIFAPDRGPVEPPPSELHLVSHDVVLSSEDGTRLLARVIPAPTSLPVDEAAWVLYLHGSTGSIGLPAYNEAWAEFHAHGLALFAVDYRGFGESEGEISEEGIHEDARAAYTYLRGELGIPASRVILYGFSLGAAVAIRLAGEVEAAGLVVEGAWLSIPQLGKERYPFLPVALMVQNRFDSNCRIRAVSMPILFVHARADAQVPIAHARKLLALASAPKSFHELGGEHGTSHKVDPHFFRAVTDFVAGRGLPIINRQQ